MKITLDTNSLISAAFWHGDSFEIVSMVENGQISLILSKSIIKEFFGVLHYKEIQEKIKNKNLEMKRSVAKIVSISSIVEPTQKFNACEDEKDNIILECAVEGRVDYIISQDNHLLKLKEFKGIKIVTPKEFLQRLKTK